MCSNVTMLSCTNIKNRKFKLVHVVYTKICTTENYPLYGRYHTICPIVYIVQVIIDSMIIKP